MFVWKLDVVCNIWYLQSLEIISSTLSQDSCSVWDESGREHTESNTRSTRIEVFIIMASASNHHTQASTTGPENGNYLCVGRWIWNLYHHSEAWTHWGLKAVPKSFHKCPKIDHWIAA